jgi:hypothetical protein
MIGKPKQPLAPMLDRSLVDQAKRIIMRWKSQSDPDRSRDFCVQYLAKLVRENKMSLLRLLEIAADPKGGRFGDAAIRLLAAETVAAGERLPHLVEAYFAMPRRPPKQGRNGGDNYLRDAMIAVTLGVLRETWPFLSMSRARGCATESVCSICAKALGEAGIPISEKRCEQIYKRFLGWMPQHQAWLDRTRAALPA